jgi:hypothetical protein
MNPELVEILGDRFTLRPTFDIVDYVGGVYGFDVYDEDRNFIAHYDIDDKTEVESQIKRDFYRSTI